MFDDDNGGGLSDAAWLGIIGATYARGARQRQERMEEYQRQQLNLLREHKGLRPIPPPQQYQSRGGFRIGFVGWLVISVILFYVGFAIWALNFGGY